MDEASELLDGTAIGADAFCGRVEVFAHGQKLP
jgi:hypothetical protein